MESIFFMMFLLSVILSMLGGRSNDADVNESDDTHDAVFEQAILAGGCFWCMEQPFQKLNGVVKVVSGYTGGHTENPTYEEVCSGTTGHYEAVQIVYDPRKITYKELLALFWRQIDPTDSGGQFVDRGSQYKTAIFFHNDEQRKSAEESKRELEKAGIYNKPIVTEIIAFSHFYKAEDYHQDYYKKCPLRYKLYKMGSGREKYLKKTWGKDVAENPHHYSKPFKEEIKASLTPIQYKVTQECETEPPFNNAYWNNKQEGIYVDIVSGKPLFSSKDKFDSGSGWPSFTKPLVPDNIVEKTDSSHGMVRTEVKSKNADSHLGHVFEDGPEPTGLRYCINSASLRFIPKEDLEKEGYGEYIKFFDN